MVILQNSHSVPRHSDSQFPLPLNNFHIDNIKYSPNNIFTIYYFRGVFSLSKTSKLGFKIEAQGGWPYSFASNSPKARQAGRREFSSCLTSFLSFLSVPWYFAIVNAFHMSLFYYCKCLVESMMRILDCLLFQIKFFYQVLWYFKRLFYEIALLVICFRSSDIRKFCKEGQTICVQNWKKKSADFSTGQLMIRRSQ